MLRRCLPQANLGIVALVNLSIDNPVGRVPSARKHRHVSLELAAEGWSLGRRSGGWDNSLSSVIGHLDTVHSLSVAGEPDLADAHDQVAHFVHRAVARGTTITQVPETVRTDLPTELQNAIPTRLVGKPGQLEWDVSAVLQRRAALRPLVKSLPTVSAVLVTRRPEFVLPMVERLAKLRYPDLEIIVGMHGIPAPEGLHAAAGERPIQLIEFAADEVFGKVVDEAFRAASGELVTKVDDDDYYSDDYLWDLVVARQYSKALLVGKTTTVIYLEALDTTVRRVFGSPESFINRVAGGALLLSAADLREVGGWPAVPRAIDSALIANVTKAGGLIYQPQDIGYLYMRNASPSAHTWNTDVGRFLANASEQWIGLLHHREFGTI